LYFCFLFRKILNNFAAQLWAFLKKENNE